MTPLGPNARALIDAAADADDPSPADAARVRARLAARLAGAAAGGAILTTATKGAASIGAPAAGGAGVAGASGAATASVGVKLLLAVAIASGATTGGALALRDERAPTFAVATSAPVVAVSTVAPRTPIATTELPAPPPASSSSPLVSAPAPSTATSPIATSLRRIAPAAAAPPPVLTTTPPAPSPLAATPPATATHPPPTIAPDTIAAEAALLRSAQTALARGDGPAALAQIEQHAARFPHGALGEEREAARVFALCRSGRGEEARAAASRFVAVSPRSPLAAQVRRSCQTSSPR